MASLDNVDMIMLNSLQNNGRITNVNLAANAGISAPPCLRRLKLLEKRGIITSYHARINPTALGYTIRAICVVSLVSQSKDSVKKFLNIIDKSDNIRQCYSSSGNESFLLSIVAKDLKDYERILEDILQASDVVASITSYLTLNKHKDEFGLPIDQISESDSKRK